MITMTRRVMFSAAYADPEPCGHNYVLDVSVEGEIDPQTGMVVNIKDIDRIVRERIVHVFDGKCIDRQVAAFADRTATAENLVAFIANELAPCLGPAVTLSTLRLEETPLRWVEWQIPERQDRKESGTMQVTRVYEFAASHRLHSPYLSDEENRELFGKCNYIHGHGHNYVLEVTVSGPVEPCSGRVVDGTLLDEIVDREVVDRYDHRHLNFDVPELEGKIPSSEVLIRVIWERLCDHMPAPTRLARVVLRETARNIFEYRGEDHSI